MTNDEILNGIYNEILELHTNREIWQYFNEELPKRGGGIVHQTLTRWYVDAQAAAVRRITGSRSQDVRSFDKLLKKVGQNIEQYANNGIDISTEILQADRDLITEKTRVITRWADEAVAHMGRKRSVDPTFNELDEAIDTLGKLLQKYYQLVTGNGLGTPKPIIQDDWRRPFQSGWF